MNLNEELMRRGMEMHRYDGRFTRGSIQFDRYDEKQTTDIFVNGRLWAEFQEGCPEYVILAALDAVIQREEP